MKHIFLLILLFSGIHLSAQNKTPSGSKSSQRDTENQFSINLLPPSLEYEISVGNKSTIDLLAGSGFLYRYNFEDFGLEFFPLFQAQYRYYYNFARRLKKGKTINNNSGNYVTASLFLEFNNSELRGLIGPAWGLQRVYGRHFKLNFNVGEGYGFNSVDSYLGTIISLQLGFKLGK